MFDELIYYCYGTETEQIRIESGWIGLLYKHNKQATLLFNKLFAVDSRLFTRM